MKLRAADASSQRLEPLRRRSGPASFPLTGYFTAVSLVAFAVLALALYLLERQEQQFFSGVQRDQNAFFAQVQTQLLREQKETARSNLVTAHEAGHVNLGNVFANALWTSRFAPLVAEAQSIPVDTCRLAGRNGTADAPAAQAQAQQACISKVRTQIMSLPGFAAADSSARALMRKTTVFKIKSYVPAMAPAGGISGVFEIYSDVTSLLQQIDVTAARIGEAAARNQTRVEEAAARNQRTVESSSTQLLLIVGVLL